MSDGDEHVLGASWPPSRFALAFERFDHPSGEGRGSIVVSHPTAPFVRDWDGDAPDRELALRRIAHDYLLAVDQELKARGQESGLDLPPVWLPSLDPDNPNPYFGWLPIRTPVPDDESGLQLTSLRLTRNQGPRQDGQPAPEDKTYVLVGTETLPAGPHPGDDAVLPINSDFGLQVVIHDRSDGTVAITSMTANLPFGPFATLIEIFTGTAPAALSAALVPGTDSPPDAVPDQDPEKEPADSVVTEFFNFGNFFEIVLSKNPQIATLYQLKEEIAYDRLRFMRPRIDSERGPILEIEIGGKGIGLQPRDSFGTPYRFAVTSTALPNTEVEPVSKSVLVTDAAAPGQARLFEQDPSSWRDLDNLNLPPACYDWSAKRPTRTDEQLDFFRRTIPIGAQNAPLEDPQGNPTTFAVRNCPKFARSDPDNNNTKTVTLPSDVWPPVRADDHSAISAYYNNLSMFTMMRGFGLDPVTYFRATVQPYDVFYRSGISPGPGKSGQTINARVWLPPFAAKSFLSGVRCPMGMHLALANFSHRARRVPPDGTPTWAEPLGIATSERWMWHEFGHALIAGRLAQLEFPFVHSVGDALAAIATDPISRLAEPRTPNDPNCRQIDPRDRFDRFRGYTFPFVFLTRRHDRCVRNGWSWGGTLHRPVIEAPEISPDQLKGYISEQILSSTLFRLYRSLGGDTVDVGSGGPDYATRRTASDVVIYLIMRGIEMFGMMPARVEELESILIQADLGLTSPFGARTALEPAPAYTANHDWRGGQAHKVIRWAFEAQGLHLPGPDHIRNHIGDKPPVDIYIEDLRPPVEKTEGGDVDHGPGTYVPVSLNWAGVPAWHAGTFARLPLPVVVKNRGEQPATNVSVRGWFGWAAGDSEASGWDRTATIHWLPPIPVPAAAVSIERAQPLTLAIPPTPTPTLAIIPTHLFILIEATCPDDHANSDPVAGLPCAIGPFGRPPSMPRALADLVANDNNLGLWMQRF